MLAVGATMPHPATATVPAAPRGHRSEHVESCLGLVEVMARGI